LNIVAHIDNFLFLYALQHGINNDEGASSSNSGTAKERKIRPQPKLEMLARTKRRPMFSFMGRIKFNQK